MKLQKHGMAILQLLCAILIVFVFQHRFNAYTDQYSDYLWCLPEDIGIIKYLLSENIKFLISTMERKGKERKVKKA